MKQITRHSRESGNPVENISRVADKIGMPSRCAGNYLINWIPAFAGMTNFAGMTKSEVTA